MKILLDEKESAAYLKNREREAILEYTSRFPPTMQKTKPLPMTDSQRSDIRKMHDDGMTPKEMAEILKLPVARVSGLVGSYCKRKVIRVPGDGTSHEDVAIPKESSELAPNGAHDKTRPHRCNHTFYGPEGREIRGYRG